MKKEMKIVGVISSASINGNTAALVREVLNGAKEKGASVNEIFLSNYKLSFCKGCLVCNAKGKCPIPDDFETIRQLIYEADGIVLGSPTYAMEYNALMKCFLERLGTYTQYASLLGGKYGIGISTSYGDVSKKVAKKLSGIFQFGIFQRSYVSGTLGAKTIINGVEIKIADDIKVMSKAKQLGSKIVSDIRSSKKYPFQNIITRLVITLFLRPVFERNIKRNKNDKEQAVYNSLFERGLIK